ncbi:uncharacterized mitochondrial protein AtMg00810-like [Medicago truncatula]|uniref:uncharacterized mitochondrial protein AtMg00810-like n=1 Tax=Medicago truncatula TaxID=3880 RepID=UPI000D2F149F|nr:uncharacterized mitochondrial protein AtMg00810-like [Medicago truncatula]
MVQHFIQQMQSEFEMSLIGELTYFLGLLVKQMKDTIFMSQGKYVKNIVKKFGMDNGGHKRTPAVTHLKLTNDESGISVDQSMYRSMIGSLLYLTASSENSELMGYCDAGWAGSADDRKRTSGGCSFLGNNLASWFNKKQNCVSLPTAKAEYIAAGTCCSQLVWMKQMLKEYNVEQDVLTLYCDNLSAINISKNPIQ